LPFVTDSRLAGYLGPDPSPEPLDDDALDVLLQNVVAGVTGLPGNLIFPRWQPEPPIHPPFGTDWVAIGITSSPADWQPSIIHVSSNSTHPDGFDAFQRMELDTLLCSFYGPNAGNHAALLRDGLFIDQNAAELRKHSMAVVEVRDMATVPELFRTRWLIRIDLEVVFRREIRRNYPVLNLLRAQGEILGGDRPIEDDWDTNNVVP
jgi:hypothetical protein